jgi:hypothetical protein
MNENRKINEDSPSVQTHLGIIQSVIQRMASNCASATIIKAELSYGKAQTQVLRLGEKTGVKLRIYSLSGTRIDRRSVFGL